MGFRFYNLNSLHKRLALHIHKHKHPPHPNRTVAQEFLTSHLQGPSFVPSQNPIYSIPRRWHLGHSHHHHDDEHRHQHRGSGEEGEKIFRLGLAADIGLATGKALTGYLTGSTAIIADAAHSVSDVVISVILLSSCFPMLVFHLLFSSFG